MFLNKTIEKNKKLIEFAIKAHQDQILMPNTYVIDFDTLKENAQKILAKAKENDLELFYMAKQYGYVPEIGHYLEKIGYEGGVVVDHQGFEIFKKQNLKVAHVGHLSQVPDCLVEEVIDYHVNYVTFYSLEKMSLFNKIAQEKNLIVNAILKIVDPKKDIIYHSQLAGFELNQLEKKMDAFKSFSNLKVVGLTSFPCFIRDDKKNDEVPTNNLLTLQKAQKIFAQNGISVFLNLPSSTAIETMEAIKKNGGKQGEPGHALTGTVRSVAFNNQYQEVPAMIYLTEISHNFQNHSYAFGGGNYGRGGMENALVGQLKEKNICHVEPIAPNTIDYYFELDENAKVGSSVTMAFRTQIFMTRSKIALVSGLKTNQPKIVGIYNPWGDEVHA